MVSETIEERRLRRAMARTDGGDDETECDHEDIDIYGNPDPFGGRIRGNVPKKLSADAECNDCGERLKVDWRFDGLQAGPR